MFAESVSDKRSVVLAAEHWIHLRTTNPIVIWRSFDTAQLRTKVTKRPSSRAAAPGMATTPSWPHTTLARRQRTALGRRPRPSRRHPQRQTARTTRRHHTPSTHDRARNRRIGGHLERTNPQVL